MRPVRRLGEVVKRVWLWLLGLVAGAVAIVGSVAAAIGWRRRQADAQGLADQAAELAIRERQQATEEVKDAADEAVAKLTAADEAAAKAVDDACADRDLVDYLRDLRRGG